MADEEPGVTITYQGKSCDAVFEMTRNVGLEPDFGHVSMHFDSFREFAIVESIPGSDTLVAKTQERAKGFLSAGTLVFKEVDIKGVRHLVQWDKILLTERGIEVAFPDDDETNEVCRVELTDIRYLWKTRGFVEGTINHPRRLAPKATGDTTGLPEPSSAALDAEFEALAKKLNFDSKPADPTQLEKEFQALSKKLNETPPGPDSADLQKEYELLVAKISYSGGKSPSSTSTTAPTTGEGPPLVAGSTDNGTPWTVETVLRKKILPRLPGEPALKIQNPRPAFFDKVVGPKTWDVILAKEALAQVLDEFQLLLALNLDASVSIWAKNDGVLQEENGGQKFPNLKTSNPNCDARLATSRRLVSYKHVPAVVVVVGQPRIRSARIRLEAVGVSRTGAIVLLEQALKEIGLTMETASRFALLPPQERSALLGVSEEGLKEFDRWAFKFYRLPDGAKRHGDKLPILKSTSIADKADQLLPLRVFSEHFAITNVLDLRHRSSGSAAATKVAEKIDQLAQIQKQIDHPEKPLSAAEADALNARKQKLELELAVIQKLVTILSGGGAEPTQPKGKDKAKAVADRIAKSVAEAKVDYYRVATNVPFGEQATGYEIDTEHGIVMFRQVQGHVFKEGVPLEGSYLKAGAVSTSTLGAQDPRGARVELEFAYRVRPSEQDNLRLDLRYFYCAVRTTNGNGELAAVKRNDVPLGSAPVVIFRPELQEIVNMDGTSNKASLDIIAERIAKEQLFVPQATDGAIVEFCVPVPLVNTGTTLSLSWAYGVDERPATTAHVGTFARLSPPQGFLRTRLGGLDDFSGVLHGSVIYPRGSQ